MKKHKPSSMGLKVANPFENLSDNHKKIIETILNAQNKLIFIDGPPGTAKTFYTVYSALQLLNRKSFKSILYLRSAIECGHSLGALPGDVKEKIDPYGTPILEKLEELLPKSEAEKLVTEKIVQIMPINYLRGTTFNDKVVILDEAQNTTLDQLYVIITRLGEHSKLILLGDSFQTDIKDKNSYSKVFKSFSTSESIEKGIVTIKLTTEDIRRNKILEFILNKLHELKS